MSASRPLSPHRASASDMHSKDINFQILFKKNQILMLKSSCLRNGITCLRAVETQFCNHAIKHNGGAVAF